MSDVVTRIRAVPSAGPRDQLLDEVCAAAFVSLRRSDQRDKGRRYVRGLLGAHGRKSIRNIAAVSDGTGAQQGLHHFVTSSTWDWRAVWQALAGYVSRRAPGGAWVVRPMLIPKVGEHSVGVTKRFVRDRGQVMNAQEAIGVWLAGEDAGFPVNCRLHLPDGWLSDRRKRTRAAIPEALGVESLTDCAVRAASDAAAGLPVRPVVLDAREGDAMAVVRRLRDRQLPYLVRVSPALGLGLGGEQVAAYRIMAAMGRPRPGRQRVGDAALVATARVRLPGRGGEADLFGFGVPGQPWRGQLWLTDVDAGVAERMRLCRLLSRTDKDAALADRVGLRDFSGRSYHGWHRHTTLASIACTVAALNERAERAAGWEPVA
ncbi:transposase [Dactylosporangium sp. NPDC000555]|uniref:IS701 family transposase n=1 Tax=Dactylosporangium sp. NPDC000555 TaxID=3154260 RepID=UPI0033196B64